MAPEDRSFLGTGWAFPPAFSRAGHNVHLVSDAKDIRESLGILLSTSLGERIMLPTYGCSLWQMVFQVLSATFLTELEDMVEQAIVDWEPRITLDSVRANAVSDVPGLVQIHVSYTIRSSNSRSNLVYPFYYLEATIAPKLP